MYIHARCLGCVFYEYWREEPCSVHKPNDMKSNCKDWEDFVIPSKLLIGGK